MVPTPLRSVALGLALALAATAAAQDFEIAQETQPGLGDWEDNVLGTIRSVDSAGSVAAHYAYGASSYQGIDPLAASEVTHLFLHRDTLSGDLALVAVHDKTHDGGGGTADMWVEVGNDPDGAAFLVEDDPNPANVDFYTGNPGDSIFTTSHVWGSCCTDGFALGTLDGPWKVEIEFTAMPTGLDQWIAYSGDGTTLPMILEPGQSVRIKPVSSCGAQNYCQANPNSTGHPAWISAHGSFSVQANDLTLRAQGLPAGVFGYFIMSESQTFVPLFGGSQGNLCLGAPQIRLAQWVLNSGAGGAVSLSVDLANLPQNTVVAAGDDWNFQCWFRDQDPGVTSNTTDGVRVHFCP